MLQCLPLQLEAEQLRWQGLLLSSTGCNALITLPLPLLAEAFCHLPRGKGCLARQQLKALGALPDCHAHAFQCWTGLPLCPAERTVQQEGALQQWGAASAPSERRVPARDGSQGQAVPPLLPTRPSQRCGRVCAEWQPLEGEGCTGTPIAEHGVHCCMLHTALQTGLRQPHRVAVAVPFSSSHSKGEAVNHLGSWAQSPGVHLTRLTGSLQNSWFSSSCWRDQ